MLKKTALFSRDGFPYIAGDDGDSAGDGDGDGDSALVLIMVLMTTSGDWRGEAWCRPPSSILSGRCSGGSTRLTFEAGPWFVFDLMST